MENNIVQDIERIIKENITVTDIAGKFYSNQNLHEIKIKNTADEIEFNDLSSLVSMIKIELKKFNRPLFINIESPTKVSVFTALDNEKDREIPYIARYSSEGFMFGRNYSHEDFVIALRSQFIQSDDTKDMLELLKKVTNAQSVETEDDGITQRVTASQGSSLARTIQSAPIRLLAPYRTFNDVEQPTSEFLFRMKDSYSFALYEADGGAWKRQAKENIKTYFYETLTEEIDNGEVVVVS